MKKGFFCLVSLLIFLLIIAGCGTRKNEQKEQHNETKATKQINLYFPEKTLTKLKKEERTIEFIDYTPEKIAQMINQGPKMSGLLALFPKEVKIMNVKVQGDIADIEFNNEINKIKNIIGNHGILLLTAGLANTYTEFPGINRVIFSVNNKQLKLLGDLDISEPIGRSENLIGK